MFMAIIEKKYRIDIEHIGKANLLTNHGILSLLESIACYHSDIAGYGINQMEQTHLTWVLLNWKVRVFKRVCYGSIVTVKTWARYASRICTLRDFEIYDEDGNLICIASSKWTLIDLTTKSIIKIPDDILNLYEPEKKSVFEETDIAKLKAPEIASIFPSYTFKVQRKDIDVNEHMHNIYYLDYAYEALPTNVYELDESNFFEVMYKTACKLGNEVCCYYTKENNENLVIMKSPDGKLLHAIVKLY